MSILIGLQHADLLPDDIRDELEQLIDAVQSAFTARLSGQPFMGLLLGVQFRDQLPPVVADELDQLTAAIQAAFATSNVWIKSTQRYTVTVQGNATAAQGLSSIVDPSNTEVSILGMKVTDNASDASNMFARVSLNAGGSAVLVTMEDAAGLAGSTTVSIEVTEFYPGFFAQPVQRGTFTITGTATSKDLGIAAVSAKARTRMLGFSTSLTSASGTPRQAMPYLELLTDSITLRGTRFNGGIANTTTISYEVSDPN